MMEENIPKAEHTAQLLTTYILENKLEIGDKIPNEYELAQALAVSRSTLRESVKILVAKNILEIRRGSGTFISDKQGMVEDPLGLIFTQDTRQLSRDIQDIRILIEPYIAAQSAIHATEEEKTHIAQLCQEVEQLVAQGVNHLKKDVEFHTAIANSCGNMLMSKIIPIINESIYLHGSLSNLSLALQTSKIHQQITAAILKGDPVAAHDAMYLHLIYNRHESQSSEEQTP